MKKKNYMSLWALSIGLWLIIVPLRGYSFLPNEWIGCLQFAEINHSIAFAILTWWAMKKYVPKAGMWRILLPFLAPWLFELALRFILSGALFSLPTSIMPLWAVITVALFYRYRKIWLLLLCSTLWLLGVTEGHKQWMEWFKFGNMPTTTVNLADCDVTDSTHAFKLSEIDADYLVLDVWYSQCGVCYREMPKVEELRNEYIDNKNVEVISLFAMLIKGETAADGYRIMQDQGLDIPVYAISEDSPILKDCDIQKYPRVLILDKNRNVIFNGSLEFAKRKLSKLIS